MSPLKPNERVLQQDLEHVFAHTTELWDQLRGANIFITGGTGFFGSWLLESFAFAEAELRLGARMVVLTRDAQAFARKASHLASHHAIELWEGDLREVGFPSGRFSHVIHAAIDYCAPLDLFGRAIEATRRTLDFAITTKAKKYLFISSGAVYGEQPPDLSHLHETYRGSPDLTTTKAAYGEAKRSSEFLCTAFYEKHGLEATIARGFAFVGPYLPLAGASAIGNFINDVLEGRPIRVTGDGTPYRSYLYGADLAIWLWRILLQGIPTRPYNVGSDAAIALIDVARTVAEVLDSTFPVEIARAGDPEARAPRYVPSIERARTELKLDSWIDLREGIRRTARWHAHRKR